MKLTRRLAQLIFIGALACSALGVTDRFNDIGHKLMCPCGCAEVLLECTHVGCRDSETMRGELASQLNSGASDRPILNFFVAKYGPTVLAAPMRGGFDNVAWIMPFAVLLLALIGTFLLVRKWRVRTVAAPPEALNTAADPLREKIRKETEY